MGVKAKSFVKYGRKKNFVHELWHGQWYYNGKRVFEDDELREIRARRR